MNPASQLRLAFIAPRFSPEGTVGGAETLIRALAEHAAADGHNVTLLTTCATDHFTWENARAPGVESHGPLTVRFFPVDEDRDAPAFLRAQQRICAGEGDPEDEWTWIRQSVNSRALIEFLQSPGAAFDHLLAGPYLFGLTYAAAEAFPGRVHLIPCLHDEVFARLQPVHHLFELTASCLFNSEPEAELARRMYGEDHARGGVVGMGMNDFNASAEALRASRALQTPYILYAGRREPLKGTPLLVQYFEAFRKRSGRELQLVFTGRGPIEASPDIEPHIVDLGFVSEETKHDAMAGAVAFVHPSINESFGIVLLESWLAGAPALVHAGGEVLPWQCRRSGGGLWFRHYPDFEESLHLLLDNPELSKKMGTAGRNYVLSEYAWPRVMQRFYEALK